MAAQKSNEHYVFSVYKQAVENKVKLMKERIRYIEKIEDIDSDLQEINETLAALKTLAGNIEEEDLIKEISDSKKDEYDKNFTWNEKVLYILEKSDFAWIGMTTSEIVKVVEKFEPELERRFIQKRVGNSLFNLSEKNEINKTETDKGNKYSIVL